MPPEPEQPVHTIDTDRNSESVYDVISGDGRSEYDLHDLLASVIDRGSMQRRGDSEEDAREQRHGKRERQDRPVHAHLAHPWQDVLAQRRIERIRRPERDHQAESATDEGEQDALGEELAQQPRPACA